MTQAWPGLVSTSASPPAVRLRWLPAQAGCASLPTTGSCPALAGAGCMERRLARQPSLHQATAQWPSRSSLETLRRAGIDAHPALEVGLLKALLAVAPPGCCGACIGAQVQEQRQVGRWQAPVSLLQAPLLSLPSTSAAASAGRPLCLESALAAASAEPLPGPGGRLRWRGCHATAGLRLGRSAMCRAQLQSPPTTPAAAEAGLHGQCRKRSTEPEVHAASVRGCTRVLIAGFSQPTAVSG